jgi:hypothetical protein
MRRLVGLLAVLGLVLVWGVPSPVDSACCYFSAKDKDILQPAQKVFITWNPTENVESFTVQPKFEGNADDFGMVIPTPSKPKLDEMPRDFFKELALEDHRGGQGRRPVRLAEGEQVHLQRR